MCILGVAELFALPKVNTVARYIMGEVSKKERRLCEDKLASALPSLGYKAVGELSKSLLGK